ncbi:MAG: hypothetical protein KOO61_09275 [Spirochaetales bacterium]|nr:hypothetical protein [Spirochaetales bacterium]
MKRWILTLLVLMMAATVFGGDLRVTIRADWMFTLRAGIEYRFGRYFGIQTDIGTNTQLLAADLCGVFYAMDAESPWQVNFLFGIPNAAMPLSFNAGFISVGGSIGVGYRFENDFGLDFRVGEGFPFFFEEGKDMIRDISFPFDLWPDVAFGVSFPP